MAQDIITYIIVAIVTGVVGFRIWKRLTKAKEESEGGGCSGCSGGSCSH